MEIIEDKEDEDKEDAEEEERSPERQRSLVCCRQIGLVLRGSCGSV